MIIEDYIRINEWLNIRINPTGNQSLYDFSEYVDGKYHTLSEAHELYNEYINNQPDRLRRVDISLRDKAIVGSANIHEIAEVYRNDMPSQ